MGHLRIAALCLLAVQGCAASLQPPITIRHTTNEIVSGHVIEESNRNGFISKACSAFEGFKTALSSWPRIRNSRQMLADASPALMGPQQQEGSGHMRAGGTTEMRSKSLQVLKVYPIKGDGRCMFRAIARALAHAEKRPLSDNYETQDADFLRKAAWQVICVDKRQAFEQARVIEGDMKQYCANMKSPNFFGGEPELFVLAEELRRPITVYVPQQGGFKAIVQYGAKYSKERPSIRILYNGSNHYDALLD